MFQRVAFIRDIPDVLTSSDIFLSPCTIKVGEVVREVPTLLLSDQAFRHLTHVQLLIRGIFRCEAWLFSLEIGGTSETWPALRMLLIFFEVQSLQQIQTKGSVVTCIRAEFVACFAFTQVR